MLSWYLLLRRLTMLEIYNIECILSAQGIEVGNLTCYILCKWLLKSLFATRKSSFFRIVNSPKVKKKVKNCVYRNCRCE